MKTGDERKKSRQHSEEEIADALRKAGGIVSVAAKKLKLTPQAVHARLEKSQALREAQLEGEELGDDLAEVTIIDAMRRATWKDKISAARVRLSRSKSKRGYNVQKVALGSEGKGGELGPVTIKFVPFDK